MGRDQPHVPHARDVAGDSWDPGQYLKFADHRLRPAVDLMGRIPLAHPAHIYDLGCGSGNVTRMLADRWPAAAVVGMDHSPQMLQQARVTPSRVRWQHGDLAEWRPEATPSLLFSNAVIHWLPDHRSLIPRLWSLLPPGGCLTVQAPMSWDLPSHRLMRETLADGGAGGTPLGGAELRRAMASRSLHDPGFYYDLLAADAVHLDVWTTEYLHALTGTDAGSGMGHRHQPAPDTGRPRRCGPRNLPGPVPRAAQARVPSAPRRHHTLPLPPPVLRRRARLKLSGPNRLPLARSAPTPATTSGRVSCATATATRCSRWRTGPPARAPVPVPHAPEVDLRAKPYAEIAASAY